VNAKTHAVKVAAAKVLSEIVAEGYEQLRKEAEPVFAQLRTELDVKSLSVSLPDGTELGSIAIYAGPPKTQVNMKTVAAIVANDAPEEFVEELSDEALTDENLLAFVRDQMPHLLTKKIRDDYLKKLIKRIDANGYLKDAAGTRIKVADVSRGEPTGKFAFTAGPGARELVWQAWQDDTLKPIVGDLLRPAIEAGEQS
jgi:DNA-binding transcriptional regulator YhcF (GntR family)